MMVNLKKHQVYVKKYENNYREQYKETNKNKIQFIIWHVIVQYIHHRSKL